MHQCTPEALAALLSTHELRVAAADACSSDERLAETLKQLETTAALA